MNGREWKPGDVALARHPITGDGIRGIIDTDSRFYTTDQSVRGISSSAFALGNLRPLVVIDPEDREQVERLATLLHNFDAHLADDPHRESAWVSLAADALREFANPTPPRPDEPMGLGAVVEDASGREWVRWTRDTDKAAWRSEYHEKWVHIAVVRILSEGVS